MSKKNHGIGKSSTGCLTMTSQKTHGCCRMKHALSKASLNATHPQLCSLEDGHNRGALMCEYQMELRNEGKYVYKT
jgi:hypothetical protein